MKHLDCAEYTSIPWKVQFSSYT